MRFDDDRMPVLIVIGLISFIICIIFIIAGEYKIGGLMLIGLLYYIYAVLSA